MQEWWRGQGSRRKCDNEKEVSSTGGGTVGNNCGNPGVSVRVFGSKACQILLMDNIFNITILHGTNVIDLGQCDADNISLITLVHALSEQLTGSSNVPAKEYSVWVQLPWCSDIVEVFTDRDLLDVFREFGVRGFDTICFRVEQTC
ncbi:hypothetical protein Ddye_022760 [Dipteronia dyeriana]|uniref:Uncharacterized protein n=1 Tax=Dipteronia dyeriana TaxID=168575 RepID=A0AAD9WSP0_9ROSI|nr:hypothetical protein Ddye_022760 [Dipteronia dyeriana]